MDQILPRLMPPGAVARKQEFEHIYIKNYKPGGHYFADLEHHPGLGIAASHIFPTSLTHNTIYAFGRKRLVSPPEVLASQGLDVFLAMSSGAGCPTSLRSCASFRRRRRPSSAATASTYPLLRFG